ncbi:MAG: right-handed parallel beta-helix repeat-containing protein [Clostridia bacterium]|nr:right-handed parallel beta-helix repeat-containing protein [Clostridia bacterium]
MIFPYTKATPMYYHISNTTSVEENPEGVKHFGVLLENQKDVVLDYKGEHIEFEGLVTPFALMNCENVTIENVSFTFAHPGVTEMTVIAVGEDYVDFRVHPQCDYTLCGGELCWVGENFSFSKGIAQICFGDKTWRVGNDLCPLCFGPVWEEIAPRILRAHKALADVQVGMTFQMRDSYRTEVGILIANCKNITLRNVRIGYAHGLCIVAQNTDTLTLDNIVCRPDNGRTTCAFADFVQVSGCKGLVTIQNGYYSGAHDDAINVHGTHLLVTDKQENTLTLRFMHPQTYDIGGFEVGETVCAVHRETLLRSGYTTVTAVEKLTEYELAVTVEDATGIAVGDAIENFSRNPDVVIRGNWFEHIPTRGILLTTNGKAVIEDNMFYKTHSQAIEISDDANSWWESGAVSDVTITHNTFLECGEPIIRILPQNKVDAYVHRNIRIVDNHFVCRPDALALWAKGTAGLTFADNRFEAPYRTRIDYCTDENGNELKGTE